MKKNEVAVPDFKGFDGEHCEATATLCLLHHSGIELSEPMFFGLGQGLGFIIWKMKIMNLPFIGGRSKPFELTRTFCGNMGIKLEERETSSKSKAWENLSAPLQTGRPVGLQLDCYHLEYFGRPLHFAGHFLCVYGYDDTHAYVVDTKQQGSFQKTSLENLERARFEKGPMAAKARSWTVDVPKALPELKEVIPEAVRRTAHEFLNPPIANFGYKGIEKLGKSIVTWLDTASDPKEDLAVTAMVMERGGTGGAIFRNFYADFLTESLEHLPGNPVLTEAAVLYREAAAGWTEISRLIDAAGKSGGRRHLEDASELCSRIAGIEKRAMDLLIAI